MSARAEPIVRIALAGLVAGCTTFGAADDGSLDGGSLDGGTSDGGTSDGGTSDAPSPACRLDAPFELRTLVPGLEGVDGYGARLSADELVLYFHVFSPDGADMFLARRASTKEPFGLPSVLSQLNSPSTDGNPMVSLDGLTLVFTSDRPNGPGGGLDLYLATRSQVTGAFGDVVPLDSLATAEAETEPYLSASGEEIWFRRSPTDAPGPGNIFRSMKQGGIFGPPQAVTEINSDADESMPVASADGLTIYFGSNRGGGPDRVWKATRTSTSATFTSPVVVDELVPLAPQVPTWLSPDGCRIYFTEGVGGPFKLLVASKPR